MRTISVIFIFFLARRASLKEVVCLLVAYRCIHPIRALTLLLILFLVFPGAPTLHAQSADMVDSTMALISDRDEKSVQGIASYVKQHYATPEDKVRAIYVWLARNIQYDMKNRLEGIRYSHIDEVIERTLTTRKALCFGYAETFRAIAAQTGIEVRVVSGYTRQHGVIDELPHSWCAIWIGGQWVLADPTWGAGYVTAGRYHSHLNYQWLMLAPDKMIASHMPFDPVWQFSFHPITNSEFIASTTSRDAGSHVYFNFQDSIIVYDKLPLIEQLVTSNRRISANGASNLHVKNQLKLNQEQIDYLRLRGQTDLFNRAVNGFNDGVKSLNAAVDLKNKNNRKLDAQIQQKLNQAMETLQQALVELNKIPPSSKLSPSAREMEKSIREIIRKEQGGSVVYPR